MMSVKKPKAIANVLDCGEQRADSGQMAHVFTGETIRSSRVRLHSSLVAVVTYVLPNASLLRTCPRVLPDIWYAARWTGMYESETHDLTNLINYRNCPSLYFESSSLIRLSTTQSLQTNEVLHTTHPAPRNHKDGRFEEVLRCTPPSSPHACSPTSQHKRHPTLRLLCRPIQSSENRMRSHRHGLRL